jgi:hypothetical protein
VLPGGDAERIIGAPPGFLNGAEQPAFQVLVACWDSENVATAIALDFHDDCGIYNVPSRRSGQAYVIEPGHDAWIVGNEPVVGFEFESQTAEHYEKSS